MTICKNGNTIIFKNVIMGIKNKNLHKHIRPNHSLNSESKKIKHYKINPNVH